MQTGYSSGVCAGSGLINVRLMFNVRLMSAKAVSNSCLRLWREVGPRQAATKRPAEPLVSVSEGQHNRTKKPRQMQRPPRWAKLRSDRISGS